MTPCDPRTKMFTFSTPVIQIDAKIRIARRIFSNAKKSGETFHVEHLEHI